MEIPGILEAGGPNPLFLKPCDSTTLSYDSFEELRGAVSPTKLSEERSLEAHPRFRRQSECEVVGYIIHFQNILYKIILIF